MNFEDNTIEIYTDGSCNHHLGVGAWAAVLLWNDNKITLTGHALTTTHQRMELTAVIESLLYLEANKLATTGSVTIYSDSQYVVDIPRRAATLKAQNFQTKRMKPVRNADLVVELINGLYVRSVELVKIKSHQRLGKGVNFNHEVDKLSRSIVREICKTR